MKGPLPYIGGKRRLAGLITSLLPTHTTYVEPFAGGCQVFFHKSPSKVEILNDVDDQIHNFLRILQQHPRALIDTLSYTVASRRQFELLSRQDPTLLTDVQRAARFFYLQKNSFGGRVVKGNFHYGVSKPSNYNPTRLPMSLQAAADRLRRVQLECGSYQDVLSRYDRPTTLFYIDPPYVDAKYYRFNFTQSDFEALASALRQLRGQFVLSINDHPLAHRLFGEFSSQRVRLSYTSSRKTPVAEELLFANFDLRHAADISTSVSHYETSKRSS